MVLLRRLREGSDDGVGALRAESLHLQQILTGCCEYGTRRSEMGEQDLGKLRPYTGQPFQDVLRRCRTLRLGCPERNFVSESVLDMERHAVKDVGGLG